MFRITLQEINDRPGKKPTTKECFRMEVDDISVLELVASIEKMKTKRAKGQAATSNGDAA